MGHSSSSCRTMSKTNPVPRATSRGVSNVGGRESEDWQVVRGCKNNTNFVANGKGVASNRGRSKSHQPSRAAGERSRSRPRTVPLPQGQDRQVAMQKGTSPGEINNTHIYIPSYLTGTGTKTIQMEPTITSTEFQIMTSSWK